MLFPSCSTCTRWRNGEGTKPGPRDVWRREPEQPPAVLPSPTNTPLILPRTYAGFPVRAHYTLFFFCLVFFKFIKSHFLSSQGVKMSTFHSDAPHYLALCLFVYFYLVLYVEKIDASVLVESAAHSWSAHQNTRAHAHTHPQAQRKGAFELRKFTQITVN